MQNHSGTCPFCGTDVRQGFNTCPSCGANYRRAMTGEELVNFMFFRATILGAFATFFIAAGAIAALSYFGTQFGFYNANAFGDEQFSKRWGEGALLAIIILYGLIWISLLIWCLRARRRFAWFRRQV